MANGDEKPPEEPFNFENLRDSAAKVVEVAGDTAGGTVAESAGDIVDNGGVRRAMATTIEAKELRQKAVEAFAEAGVKNLLMKKKKKATE